MAYQEFYFDSNGSNLNGGSNAGAAKYTSTNGNWNSTTRVFTPTDGTNPVSAGVVVGDYASFYNDGATLGVFIARVTAVTNASNGAITVDATKQIGTAPSTSATGRSVKVGGAFNSMFNATGWPLIPGAGTISNLQDASGSLPRFNFKNDQTYSSTAANTFGALLNVTLQGYSTTVGDGGKAIWSNSTTAGTLFSFTTGPTHWKDIIFVNTGGSGAQTLVAQSTNSTLFERCVFHDSRGIGLSASAGVAVVDSEFYANNKSNTSALAAVKLTGANNGVFINCFIHDNTGSNSNGIYNTGGNTIAIGCIFASNGNNAIQNDGTGAGTNPALIFNCDFYNNGAAAILLNNSGQCVNVIRNNNFLKNATFGIAGNVTLCLGSAQNNAYGAGTQANGSADVLKSVQESGKITYASNVTPWTAEATGNFTLSRNATTAWSGAGLQTFTETDGTNSGTSGFPDIGAAQSNPASGSASQKAYTFGG